jgi:hypothetical protein
VAREESRSVTGKKMADFSFARLDLGVPPMLVPVLRAMLRRQGRGEFQNGVRDAGGQGIDWTNWDGKLSGYEG